MLVPALAVLLVACATAPRGTYFPDPKQAISQKVSHAIYRAARAAGDDPTRYSFALVPTDEARVYSGPDAAFYVTEGLARLSESVLDAEIAREVAHEVLGHAGQRRALWVTLSAGFTALGIALPGLGLADFLVTPLVVRAFSRSQEKEADAKAVEVLRAMGHDTPRRTLWSALQTLEAINGKKHSRGLLATHPKLAERLATLEPLEPVPVAKAPHQPSP